MKIIDIRGKNEQEIMEVFSKNGFAAPRKKRNKKYGIKGSSVCDRVSFMESLETYIPYLEKYAIIIKDD